jgi:uncharacterized protein YjbJ (UPF0337 family)
MNKDKFEGGVRSAVGQGESFVGASTDDKASEVKGAYNKVAGSAQTAWGSAKEAAKETADSGSIPDLSRLRDDIAKLTQTVSDLAQKQVASSRDQVAGVVAAAGDSCRSRQRSRRTSSPPWRAMSRRGLRRTHRAPSPLRA